MCESCEEVAEALDGPDRSCVYEVPSRGSLCECRSVSVKLAAALNGGTVELDVDV